MAARCRFCRSAEDPDGHTVPLNSLPLEHSNPIAYYVEHIQTRQPIGGLLSGKLNVEMNEILDAAKESIRTGTAVSLPAD